MTVFHLVLGIAVVVLCATVGVLGLMGRSGPAESAIAGWALAALVVQVASGMFLLTATESAGVVHLLLPLVGLAAVLGARAMRSEIGPRLAGTAYLAATAAAVVAFATGVTS